MELEIGLPRVAVLEQHIGEWAVLFRFRERLAADGNPLVLVFGVAARLGMDRFQLSDQG